MGLSNPLFHFFNPLILVLMSIPGIALAPLFIIWLGFGDPTIITLGALSTFFPVVYSTTTGVRSVDKQMVRAAQIMGATPLQVITSVYIPWSAAFVFNGVKLGLARGWMTVIAVEFVAASNYGLGYMIWYATEQLQGQRGICRYPGHDPDLRPAGQTTDQEHRKSHHRTLGHDLAEAGWVNTWPNANKRSNCFLHG